VAALGGSGSAPVWEIRSDLPGRVRLRCQGLADSEALRRHCRTVLTGCHWLEGFRINPMAGCLSLRFPIKRRDGLDVLVELALTLPHGFTALQDIAQRKARSRNSVRHAAFCAGLLGVDWLVGVPMLALQGATALLMVPVVLELLRRVREQRVVPVEALDLGFSAVLLQQGLPREALMDLALDDGSTILQEESHHELSHADYRDLMTRLAQQECVRTAGPAGVDKPIGELRRSERIQLQTGDPVFVPCQIVSGELVAINRQLTGDWHPRQYRPGDALEPGCLVLSGAAELTVLQAFADCPQFQLPSARQERRNTLAKQAGQRVLNPLLFTLGCVLALRGASEQALAAFQFNPINDWETSRNANRLAAAAELRLHGINIANPDVFSELGSIQRLLVSHSCEERLHQVELKEECAPEGGLKRGELLRILAGVQQWLVADSTLALWNIQLENVSNPIPVKDLKLHDLSQEGWTVDLLDGRRLQVARKRRPQASTLSRGVMVEPLEFRDGERCLGWVTLQRKPNPNWKHVRQQLQELGIAVEVVGQSVDDPAEASERVQRVEAYQARGERVGYLGDVIQDIPALARADVAIGLDFDEAGMLTRKLCDLALSRDPQWLPRLVVLSRSLKHTADGNAVMIGLTHMLSSVATAGLAISPLQTVLLADIPLLLAEWRNINSFRSHTRGGANSPSSWSPC
jgi:hypothetical protein